MISLIICSRRANVTQQLKDNINLTIGVVYELIVIDNSQNNYSIFSAYNEGVKRAKYPYLCFMHDDIFYYTDNWGEKVLFHFQKQNTGLIGVIGSHYLPNTIAYWHDIIPSYLSGVVPIQDNKKFEYLDSKKSQESSVEVAIVDGMWFCMPKKAFETIRFDDAEFNGFHMYDMDICMQVMIHWHKQVKVVFDISVGHYTSATTNDVFIENLNVFYKKWQTFLPIHRNIVLDEKLCNYMISRLQQYYTLFDKYCIVNKKFNTKSYRLGKMILNPFLYIQRQTKKLIGKQVV